MYLRYMIEFDAYPNPVSQTEKLRVRDISLTKTALFNWWGQHSNSALFNYKVPT